MDNFLITRLKGVPKSHIYRIVRKGEVRVNKSRVDVKYRLVTGDIVRIPPIRVAERSEESYVPQGLQAALQQGILFEDEGFLIVNKPAGFAVHGGSGVSSGIIEGLRLIRPDAHFLELVHRLDKDTSGCLLIAKKRSALRKLQELFRNSQIQKTYQAWLSWQWIRKKLLVTEPLLKNISKGGERVVVVHLDDGILRAPQLQLGDPVPGLLPRRHALPHAGELPHKRRLSCADCHGKKILIVTDSKHGSTAAYSDKLGAALCSKGFQVDVGRAHKMLTTDISGYDGYIIGRPTYWGFPLKDLRKFLEINSTKFAQKSLQPIFTIHLKALKQAM